MREEKQLQRSLNEVKQRREQLAVRNRLLRQYYRERSRQRALRPATVLGAGALGAACGYLAGSGKVKPQRRSFIATETRFLLLNLLDRQCERWLSRITAQIAEGLRSGKSSATMNEEKLP